MWLHKQLETYRSRRNYKKAARCPHEKVPSSFGDEEELEASSNLSELIGALRESRYLIVVCSPRTPESEVNKEVIRFRELDRVNKILALLVEGEPKESFCFFAPGWQVGGDGQ